jgi:rubredoxin
MSWIGRLLRRDSRGTVTYDSVRCPVCGGNRVIEGTAVTRYKQIPYVRVCRKCNGTGYVTVKKREASA